MSDNRDDFTKWWDKEYGNFRGSAIAKSCARMAYESRDAIIESQAREIAEAKQDAARHKYARQFIGVTDEHGETFTGEDYDVVCDAGYAREFSTQLNKDTQR